MALAFLRAHWRLLIVSVVVVGAVVGGVLLSQQKKYTATLTLAFNNSAVSQTLAGLNPVGSSDPQSTLDTNLALVTLGDVAAKTARALGGGTTAESVRGAISASSISDTSLVAVAATASTPKAAARLANTYGQIFVSTQNASATQSVDSALAVVEAQLAKLRGSGDTAQISSLSARAQSLQVLAATEGQSVQVAEAAQPPTSPSSPKTKEDLGLAIIIGLIVGLVLGIVRDQLDQRIGTPDDVEREYQRPVLAAIPEDPKLILQPSTSSSGSPELLAERLDAFGVLRSFVRFVSRDRQIQVIVVASGTPGDGKSVIASNLAAAAVLAGSRVLLVEADMRRPVLAPRLGLPAQPGLVDLLLGAASVGECVRQLTIRVPSDAVGSANSAPLDLDVLFAGSAPPNPSRLLESAEFTKLLAAMRERYDLVVIDTPPVTLVPDAFPLLAVADGVIAVSRMGQDKPATAKRVRSTLESAHAPFLGVVANCVRKHDTPYGDYGYYTSNHGTGRDAVARPRAAVSD